MEVSLFKLLLLQVVENDGGRLSLKTPILDDDTRAANNFASLALLVNLAETSPFTELLIVVHLHQWDVVLLAESRYKFFVHGLTAIVCQNTKQSLAPKTKRT